MMSAGLSSVDPAKQALQNVAAVSRRVSRPGLHTEQVLLV